MALIVTADGTRPPMRRAVSTTTVMTGGRVRKGLLTQMDEVVTVDDSPSQVRVFINSSLTREDLLAIQRAVTEALAGL